MTSWRKCFFFILNETCQSSRCSKHRRFDATKSRSYRRAPDGDKLSIEYLSGKIEGELGQDTIHIGSFEVKNQFFGAAEQIDVPLLDIVEWDGIVGLAFPNKELAKKHVIPVVDQMMQNGVLKPGEQFFAYFLGDEGGSLTFGSIDRAHLSTAAKPHSNGCSYDPLKCFEFIPVTNPGFWTIQIMDLLVAYDDKTTATSTGICKGKADGRYE